MISKLKILTALTSALLLTATGAMAGGDPESGKTKAQTCVSCHGETGMSVTPLYPNLAGQYEDYLVQALTDYRDGDRDNAIMKGFATALTDQDIDDLAAYFSSQEGLFTPSQDQW